jgi:hypothetical protein
VKTMPLGYISFDSMHFPIGLREVTTEYSLEFLFDTRRSPSAFVSGRLG